LKYGYPFEGIRDQLEKNRNKSNKIRITDDKFWWEQLAGDLAMTLNHGEPSLDTGTYEELDEVYEIVETEIKYRRRL
jgi:hypothetical protein